MADESEPVTGRVGEENRGRTGRRAEMRLKPEKQTEFSVSFDLQESGDKDVLTPLDPKQGGFKTSKLRFDIELECDDADFRADQGTFVVYKGNLPIFRQALPAASLAPGEHVFEWDGYLARGTMSTEFLKNSKLSAYAAYRKGTTGKSSGTDLSCSPEEVSWVDVRVEHAHKIVFVKVYINCQNGGMTDARFRRLRDLVYEGIRMYWSRIITVEGVKWRVLTTANEREDNSEDLDLYWVDDKEFSRSHNSGIIDASIFYNWGYWQQVAFDADQEFRETAAHEFGHAILEAYGGKDLSWGHKGTVGSSLLKFWNFQAPLDTAPYYPASGEIDLMKYYHEKSPMPADYYARVVAAEEDVKRLMWLGRLEFDGP